MPYEGERAGYGPLRRLVESERVQSLLSRYEIQRSIATSGPPATTRVFDPPRSGWDPEWVLAIDGSYQEVPLQNGYPGAQAAYVTVASVMLDVAKVRELDQQRPVNPVLFRSTQSVESLDCALPGSNVLIRGEESAIASLRRALLDVMADQRAFADGESLLDTYETLLALKPTTGRVQGCPYGEDCLLPNRTFHAEHGQYECPCQRQAPLYSTDALRIHEGMNPVGSNGAMFAEIMQVLERIWMIHVLRGLDARGWLSSLGRVAVVLDGPLAVFGHPAWLSAAISQELVRINDRAREATGGQDILVLGIEKTGYRAPSFFGHPIGIHCRGPEKRRVRGWKIESCRSAGAHSGRARSSCGYSGARTSES